MATPDEKAIRIVKALECYASGNWTWLLTEPHLLLDVSAISRDYTRLCPHGFQVAAEQAKALFVQAVIVDSPWLTEWEQQARFFTCNKCHADRVAIPAKPKPRCPNCGRALSHPQTIKDMERNWTLAQYWLDEITEAEAAKSLNMTVIELHQTAVKRFGKLHVNEGEQDGNLE